MTGKRIDRDNDNGIVYHLNLSQYRNRPDTFMSNLIRYVLVVALGLSCVGLQRPADGQTTPQSKTIRKAPTGSISGRVTIRGKGKAGIVVGLHSAEYGPQQGTTLKDTTDAQGNYRIAELPAGNYLVAPIAPAFVGSDLSSFGLRGKALLLAEGESVDGIDFSIVRGGVITGKVTNADGRPVIEERVYLLPVDPTNSQGGPDYSFNGVQTDDRGIYRMFGLAPGRYKVAVGQSEGSAYRGSAFGRPYYRQTFHPDVSDISKATVVEVTEGSETSKVDLTLGRVAQTYAASGRIIDGDSEQPVANVRLGVQMIIDSRGRSFGGGATISSRLGEFRLENLIPGKYVVFLMPQQPESSLRVNEGAFEVVDRDVEGLVIKTAKGATLAGNIFLENSDDKAVRAKLSQLGVEVHVESEGPGFGHRATIGSDGSFRLSGLEAGTAHISLGARDDLLKGFSVSRIERDGIAQTTGIQIKAGEDITGVRLVVSYGTASIRGAVKLENGTLPAGARIFIRVTKAGEATSTIPPPAVDARGHFVLEGLPGGTYDFVTTVYTPGSQRRSLPVAKQQVTVPDGVVTEVTITVDLDQKTSPQSP